MMAEDPALLEAAAEAVRDHGTARAPRGPRGRRPLRRGPAVGRRATWPSGRATSPTSATGSSPSCSACPRPASRTLDGPSVLVARDLAPADTAGARPGEGARPGHRARAAPPATPRSSPARSASPPSSAARARRPSPRARSCGSTGPRAEVVEAAPGTAVGADLAAAGPDLGRRTGDHHRRAPHRDRREHRRREGRRRGPRASAPRASACCAPSSPSSPRRPSPPRPTSGRATPRRWSRCGGSRSPPAPSTPGADKPRAVPRRRRRRSTRRWGCGGSGCSTRRPASADRAGVLDRQLAALVGGAADAGVPLKVMAPMISTADEARRFVARARAAGAEQVGVMIEVPAAVLNAPELLAEVDFVSVGTNDLTQYVFAADRQSGALAAFNDPWQPAVLRLLDQLCRAAEVARHPGRGVRRGRGRPGARRRPRRARRHLAVRGRLGACRRWRRGWRRSTSPRPGARPRPRWARPTRRPRAARGAGRPGVIGDQASSRLRCEWGPRRRRAGRRGLRRGGGRRRSLLHDDAVGRSRPGASR